MGNKNKSKKRSLKLGVKKFQKFEHSTKNSNSNEQNMFAGDLKLAWKEMPFASISNKQFKKLGYIPEKKTNKTLDTIPLRFPSKLMPTFKKIFGLGKTIDKEKVEVELNERNVKTHITLINFQSYTHDGQQTIKNTYNLPTLQISQIPLTKNIKQMGLCLTESNIKLSKIPDALYNKPPPQNEIQKQTSVAKVCKKRSFFNDIWKKKITSSPESPPPLNNDQKHEDLNTMRSVSPKDFNFNMCISCNKQAFMAERIQIGTDVFHNSCFKCIHCAKCLYRGKWNKHQSHYYCDYCYRRLMWPFVRR